MARPVKDGIDYFPLDTDFLIDDKIRLIKAEFGAKGILILIALFCDIYRTTGYYKVWSEDACFLMADAVGCGCAPENIRQVVLGCLRRSIFDNGVFKVFGILTSAGIQRRYLRAVSTRDSISMIREYWLLDENNKKDVQPSVLKKIAFLSINSKKTPVSLEETPDNLQINPQSKGKKSKEKNIYIDGAKAPLEEYLSVFISCCPSLTPPEAWTPKRKKLVLSKSLTPEQMAEVFRRVEASDFLTGRTGTWKADFEWILEPDHWQRIKEGYYDNRKPAKSASTPSFDLDEYERTSSWGYFEGGIAK